MVRLEFKISHLLGYDGSDRSEPVHDLIGSPEELAQRGQRDPSKIQRSSVQLPLELVGHLDLVLCEALFQASLNLVDVE